MAGGKIWTSEEIEALRRSYPHYPNAVLAEMFPERTVEAIRHAASRLGLHKTKVIDGRAMLVNQETGEIHELPIDVVERPAMFEFVPADTEVDKQ